MIMYICKSLLLFRIVSLSRVYYVTRLYFLLSLLLQSYVQTDLCICADSVAAVRGPGGLAAGGLAAVEAANHSARCRTLVCCVQSAVSTTTPPGK